MIPLSILGGLLLLGVPGWASGLLKRGYPADWVRQGLALQLTGLALVEAGLLLWATPALLDLIGATDLALICRRMFGGLLPSGWLSGAGAGALALAVVGLAARSVWRVMAAQHRLRVELWLGSHNRLEDFDLVVVPTDELVGYTVAGRPPQVVLSRGLLQAVDTDGMDAVIAHEAVHIRHRHHRFLLGVGAIEGAFGWYPLAARGTRIVRLALERWADEESAELIGDGREGIRRALLAVTVALVNPAVAGFGSADTVAERVRALSIPVPPSRWPWVAAGYLSVGLGALGSLGWLAWATWMSILALANPGMCVL